MKDWPSSAAALSSRDRATIDRRTERFRVLPRVSLAEITGTGVPPRIDLFNGFREDYRKIGKMPWTVINLGQRPDGNQEFVAVGTPPHALSANDINKLFYFIAPVKSDYLDTYLIVDHWHELLDTQKLLKGHGAIPGFPQFLASGTKIFEVLANTYTKNDFTKPADINNPDVFVPAIHWVSKANGDKELLLDPPNEELKSSLTQAVPGIDTSKINVAAGLAMLGAYSPEVTTRWPEEEPYLPSLRGHKNVRTQEMGIFQALANVYRSAATKKGTIPEDQDINRSPVLRAFEQHEIPPYDGLEAIRKRVMAFFGRTDLGVNLEREATYRLFRNELVISTNIDGQKGRHSATYARNERMEYPPVAELHQNTGETVYSLEEVRYSNRVRVELHDYPDGTSSIAAFSCPQSKYHSLEPLELNNDGKTKVKQILDIDLS